MDKAYTLLMKGEHAAIVGDARGNLTIATAHAVDAARQGFFAKPLPVFGDTFTIPRIARVENEAMVINDELTLRAVRYAVFGEVVECWCVFDDLEKNWYVREAVTYA